MIGLKIFGLCLVCESGTSAQKVKQKKNGDRSHVVADFFIVIFISVTLKSKQEQHYSLFFFLFTFLLFVLQQMGAQEAVILNFYMASRRARNLFPLLSGRKQCNFATD